MDKIVVAIHGVGAQQHGETIRGSTSHSGSRVKPVVPLMPLASSTSTTWATKVSQLEDVPDSDVLGRLVLRRSSGPTSRGRSTRAATRSRPSSPGARRSPAAPRRPPQGRDSNATGCWPRGLSTRRRRDRRDRRDARRDGEPPVRDGEDGPVQVRPRPRAPRVRRRRAGRRRVQVLPRPHCLSVPQGHARHRADTGPDCTHR